MRGEASRIADRESRDSLAPKLRDTREDAWRIGNELFTITKHGTLCHLCAVMESGRQVRW